MNVLDIFVKIRDVMVPPPRLIESEGRERPADWYDLGYLGEAREVYDCHYTKSPYYFLWAVIGDRIPSSTSLLEVGCGPGQLAQFLADRGVSRYIGFDFSQEAVRMARRRCPSLEFWVADGLTTNLFEMADYNLIVCTEVLEHIENDLELVSRIKPGVRCLMTVPNFPYISHVRYFESCDSVVARYGNSFSSLTVDWFLMRETGQGFFLLDGVRNNQS